jgi:hypothetical protein
VSYLAGSFFETRRFLLSNRAIGWPRRRPALDDQPGELPNCGEGLHRQHQRR